jgi:FG-GAP-like repeat
LSKPPAKPSFIFPNDFGNATSHLYHNQGDGTFKEMTAAAGLEENPGRAHKALAADFSQSGHLDLLLLRDNKPPVLYRNKGQGSFEDRTWYAGGENWKYAYVDGQLSDFDHDGKIDLALWSTIGNEVLMNQGDGKFEQEKTFPIVFAANRAFGFHGTTADLNGDGFEDLLMVDNNGEWHYIANHHGKFALGAVKFEPASAGKTGSRKPVLPALASLLPVRLAKSGKVTLIGVQMDGRIVALEPRSKQPSNAKTAGHPSHSD